MDFKINEIDSVLFSFTRKIKPEEAEVKDLWDRKVIHLKHFKILPKYMHDIEVKMALTKKFCPAKIGTSLSNLDSMELVKC